MKTNIGHLDSAAGVAGLIKTVLALEHGAIPPSLHFESPNPELDLAAGPFHVNTALTAWPATGRPRRAGVSSFGIGGTNAHVVLEQAPPTGPAEPSRPWQLLTLSARTASALEAMTENLARHLAEPPPDRADDPLADVAYTLQVGRKSFPHRRVLVCRDRAAAAAALRSRDPESVRTQAVEARARPDDFLVPGQGAQHVGMGRELYDGEPAFRAALDRCAGLLTPHLGLDLRRLLYPAAGAAGPDARADADAVRALEQTAVAQPALFAVEYALAQLWSEWGVRPAAMLGHSVGEYVAACLAGVLTLADALALVAERGRLMQALPAGAMTTVPLPAAEVAALLTGGLAVAAVNAPASTVVSGPLEEVAALEDRLRGAGVDCRRLHTSHAFHSAMMEPVLEPFMAAVGKVRLAAPRIPYLSNLTGGWIEPAQATDPRYWARHLRETVRFGDAVGELLGDRSRVLLEVGPGRSLGTLVRRHPEAAPERVVIASLSHPREAAASADALGGALGRLWLAGVKIDWAGVHAHERRRRVRLPTYPFERQRYWLDPARRVPRRPS